MLAIPVIVIIVVFALSLSWLFFVIYRHRRILQHIRYVFANAGAAQINGIYTALTRMAGKPSPAYIVARTNTRAETQDNIISLPQALSDFAWAGKVVHITVGTQIRMEINNEGAGKTQLGGRVYASIPVPYATNPNTGHTYIQYSPYKWLDQNDALISAARQLSPRYAEKLLSYLVTPGKDDFSFEPACQVRIGDGISWLHKPSFPACEVCGERMRFILQCPGSLLNHEEAKHATYYLFGCDEHTDHIQCVTQYQ